MNLQFHNKLPMTRNLFGDLFQPLSRSCKIVSINDSGACVPAVKDRMLTNTT